MKITVTGKQIDVGNALRRHVEERLTNGVAKYFDGAMEGHVVFSHEGPLYRAHIHVRVGKGPGWESGAEDSEIYASFNLAAEHMDKQLRRHKRKLRDHGGKNRDDILPTDTP